jgi:hypothetical protein
VAKLVFLTKHNAFLFSHPKAAKDVQDPLWRERGGKRFAVYHGIYV